MKKLFTTAAILSLFAAPVFADDFQLQNGCLAAEAFSDFMEYAEDIEYIGTAIGETDRLGYTSEYDLLKQNGLYFTAEYNPYENIVCTYRAENHTIHMVSRG